MAITPLYGKVANRVSPWHGRFMSSAARLILTNTSLSSLPMFTMGMFLLADGVHAKLNTPPIQVFLGRNWIQKEVPLS